MIRFWLNQIEYCVIWIAERCSRAGASNYIPHMLLGVITCPCHWYLLLVQHSSYMLRWWQWPRLFSGALSLQWRHNERDGVSNHRCLDCFLNRLFRRRSKEPSKLHVTGLCAGNTPMTGEFPAQRTSNAENVSIWWRHHGYTGKPFKRFKSSIYRAVTWQMKPREISRYLKS